MSTRVVGYEGEGRARRPIVVPVTDPEPRYGFMEPAHSAPIERRKATREELEAARAREDEPRHLVAPSIAKPPLLPPADSVRDQASRERGGAVTAELTRKPRPSVSYRPKPEEEPAVSEAPADIPENIPEPVDDQVQRFTALVEATTAAKDAWIAKLAADVAASAAEEAWSTAQGELARTALAAVGWPDDETDDVDLPGDDDHAHYVLTVPLAPDQSSTVEARPRTRPGRGQRAGQAAARDRRAKLVMGAMARLGDDMGAVATELGMKKNAVAQIVKFARKRAEKA